MNKLRIENLNVIYDQEYHSIDEASQILKGREDSVLTKTWFMLKLKNRELIPLYDNQNQLFIYIDNHNSMYGVQFYNPMGELVMTYPWNGSLSLYNEGQLVNDYKERFGINRYSKLKAIDIVIRNDEIIICDEIGDDRLFESDKDDHHEIRVFNMDGVEKNMHQHLVGTRAYEKQIEVIRGSYPPVVDAKMISMEKEEEDTKIN